MMRAAPLRVPAPPALHVRAPLDPIDQLLAEEGAFDRTPAETARLRLRLIQGAVRWHLAPGAPYAGYAARRGFDPAMLDEPAGLARVPLLPSALFKRPGVRVAHPTRCTPAADDVLWTTSSGTKGSISRIPRDDTTLRRFFASIGNLANEMLRVENPSILVFNLGPDAEEARDLWISYVMAGVTVMLPRSTSYVQAGAFQLERAIRDLLAVAGQRVALIGPPPLLLELATALSARGAAPRVAPDSVVMTIGGWKRRSGERIARAEFDRRTAGGFGVPLTQVRDSFNMVELNTVMIECAEKQLHVPPWLWLRARDCSSLEVLPPGELGVLGYLDATPLSYPGFVLSDDLGRVHEEVRCACGRTSDVVQIARRLNTIESRGCALKMDGVQVR